MKRFLTPSLWADMLLNALLAVAAASAWPIFETPWYLLVAVTAIVAGNVVAGASLARKWQWWHTLLVAYGSYVALGMLVASPSLYSQPSRIGAALMGIVIAPVTGWKNILTLDMPLGTYQEILALPFFLLFTTTLITFLFAWRLRRWWGWAAVPAWVFIVESALLGTRNEWFPFQIPYSAQLITGVVATVLTVAWAVWRLAAIRKKSLRSATTRSGVSAVQRGRTSKGLRRISGVVIVALSVVIAALVTPMMAHSGRTTLREGTDPELFAEQQLSPLVSYRQFFDDEHYSQPLFLVDGAGERVRLAILDHYDGKTATLLSASPIDSSTFVRVPSFLPTSNPSEETTFEIRDYTGAWVPLVGELESITFTGANAQSLNDGFFYSRSNATGLQTADGGLSEGDIYRIKSAPYTVAQSEVTSFRPSNNHQWAAHDQVPSSVAQWVAAQDLGSDGASLVELISRLRSRGYLSHSLDVNSEEPPAWAADLGEVIPISSRPGHSAGRVGTMFSEMLQRQLSLPANTDPAMLVATTGDDEQFAVAAALIADHLGYDVRVVVGAVLSREHEDRFTVPLCENGTCFGRNISAWIEVRDAATGAWAPLDVTPQWEMAPLPEPQQGADPENYTPVQPKQVESIPPPAAYPQDADAPDASNTSPELSDQASARIWRNIGIGALILLLLVLPVIAILGAKALRRSSRYRNTDPRKRVVAGWEQFVDEAIDFGLPEPGVSTRSELAMLYDPYDEKASYLANGADFAAFSSDPISEADAKHYWDVVASARATLAGHEAAKKKWRAKLSLRSFKKNIRQKKEMTS